MHLWKYPAPCPSAVSAQGESARERGGKERDNSAIFAQLARRIVGYSSIRAGHGRKFNGDRRLNDRSGNNLRELTECNENNVVIIPGRELERERESVPLTFTDSR